MGAICVNWHRLTVKFIGLLFNTYQDVVPDTKQLRYKSYVGKTVEVIVVKVNYYEGNEPII